MKDIKYIRKYENDLVLKEFFNADKLTLLTLLSLKRRNRYSWMGDNCAG